MPSSAAALGLALALLAGGTGCADHVADTDPTVASDPATTSAPTAAGTSVPETIAPPFTADTRPADGGAGWESGNGLGLTAVRTSRRTGYDRVVFHLDGTGAPGWRVEYTTSPTGDGSGEPVPLEGTVFLQVVLRGIGHPYDTGIAPFGDGATRVPGTGTSGVTEIAPGGFFEGAQQAFIGLTGARRPFRVFALANPARVVVDVRHS
jgi:hypothetical protein